ncbi:MAG: DUF4421 domain-containing protein [Leptolyngbya sp. SIO3F4]|nr:DUF4421 domain-containing protein [Leptolyngbya sp. SIO3F4]
MPGHAQLFKPNYEFDPDYITNCTDLVLFKFSVSRQINNLEWHNTIHETRIHYRPNDNLALTLGGNYRGLGLAFSYSTNAFDRDTEEKGTTRALRLQFQTYQRKFFIESSFERYTGFFIENPEEIGLTNAEVYPQLDDLSTVDVRLQGYRVFNDRKFSFRALHLQTERQFKSAGTWLLGGVVQYYGSLGGTRLIPEESQRLELKAIDVNRFRNVRVSLSGGYAYTWVFHKRLFLSGVVLPDVGWELVETRNAITDVSQQDFSPSVNAEMRAVAGYTVKNFFAGVMGWMDLNLYHQVLENNFLQEYRFIQVFVGVRLDLLDRQ